MRAQKYFALLVLSLLMLSSLACSLSSLTGAETAAPPPSATPQPAVDLGLAYTQTAMAIQQQQLAMQSTALALTQQAGALQPQQQPTDKPIELPQPTSTPQPTATTEPTATPDVMQQIKDANILVYEDIAGNFDLDRRIKRALNNLNLNGPNVVDVADRLGDFMKMLNSGKKWDLIIVGAEDRNLVSGDFWDVIHPQLKSGSAMIAEMWYLDRIASGKIAPVLHDCGIDFARDWRRAYGANPNDFVVYALAPDNPVFHDPNEIGGFLPPDPYWVGDAGDLLASSGSGTATMLAGLYKNNNSTAITLASCFDGRVIFQTHSTHDFDYSTTVAMWENYITTTLKAHFAAGY